MSLSCDESSCDSCVNNGVINECNNYLGPSSECPSFKELIEFERCRLKYRSKECSNECKSCLSYELPSVPLCGLSYSREETINLPGFQLESSPVVSSIKPLGEGAGCFNEPPTTKPGVASACGTASADIQSNINEIQIFS